MHLSEAYGNAKDFPFDLFATDDLFNNPAERNIVELQYHWDFEYILNFFHCRSVTKNQITNFKFINSIFSQFEKGFFFAKTTKIKTKKFGIWFLVTGKLVYIEILFYLSIKLRGTNNFKLNRSSCKDCKRKKISLSSNIIFSRFHEFIKKFSVTIRLELLWWLAYYSCSILDSTF